MKLAIIGGGGVRAPLFVGSALIRSGRIHLDEICLMDNQAEKLDIMATICRQIGQKMGSTVRITSTTLPEAAMDGAAYVVTTIRVGNEQGRVLDERIALKMGILGQETTGSGGFAMAMRSIPYILKYAELLDKVNPQAWMFNFTNPAGLVTQALYDRGHTRAIGICDGANQAQHEVASYIKIDPARLEPEVFGLNHLSWTRSIKLKNKEILIPLLEDTEFLTTSALRVFEPELIKQIGMWINEYLYYYYYSEKAVEQILADGKTRGEEIMELNQRLLSELGDILIERNPQKALSVYHAYNQRREATYMHYARPDAPSMELADQATRTTDLQEMDFSSGEGYAGVALDIIQGLEGQVPVHIALNIPNQGAISCMQASDVVEVSSIVRSGHVNPIPIGQVPEHQELLMRSIKHYERLAVEAILARSKQKAAMALMAHPLVLSYSRACDLVRQYISAHQDHIGEWQ